jgi:putative ABC transport system permease protein
MATERMTGSRLVILRSLVAEAAASLRGRRMQAMLSSFGIATGIAAVVLLVSLVSGVHRMALQTMNAAGGNVIMVSVEPDPGTAAPRGFPLTLRPDDLDAVLSASRLFETGSAENSASAVVRGAVIQGTSYILDRATGTAVLTRGARAMTTPIRGFTAAGFELQNLHLADGRLPLADEFERGERVAVLGPAIARQIFGTKNPVGQPLVLGDWPFRVIGVLQWVGEPSGEFRAGVDRYVYVPFHTVANVFRGNETASLLRLRRRADVSDEAAMVEARGILSRRQKRLGETSGQLEITSTVDRLREMNLVITGLKLLVALVGGIGLFVGAVGVANVLLVSVRERTVEIGVRRAIGARRQDVFLGFLFEALAITLSGGLLGIAGAWMLTQAARLLPIPDGAEPHISLVTAGGAVLLLMLVGIAAGVGPARRAASVFPAEALRAE